MKISTKGRYALRMMVDLAEHQNGEYISLKDIALRQEVSKKYLEQIVPILNKSGRLPPQRGLRHAAGLARAEPRHQRISRRHHAAGPARPAAGALCQ